MMTMERCERQIGLVDVLGKVMITMPILFFCVFDVEINDLFLRGNDCCRGWLQVEGTQIDVVRMMF